MIDPPAALKMVSGAAIAFAALLLILPGFATDIMGLLLVFPVTRKIILSRYSNKYSARSTRSKSRTQKKNYIEGEYEDIEDKDGK